MLSGTAPVPVSSGRTDRHRLNRLGDRQLNRALNVIAVNRMRCHPATQAYVQRRRAEGRTDREIRRCIKRYIARHLYRTLTSGGNSTPRAT
jgi:transposase